MKAVRTFIQSLFVICLVMCLSVTAYAADGEAPVTGDGQNVTLDTALSIPEGGILDNLNTETDARWYSFSVAKEGDAVIVFHSDRNSTKANNWECAVYAQDRSTLLKTADYGKGYSYLAVNDLDTGTYYIRVQMTQQENPSGSPNLYGFSKGQYSLKVITCASSRANVEGDTVLTVSEPGTLLCVLDGTVFLKAYEGEAIVGLYTNKDGLSGPLLVGIEHTNERSVAYFSSKTGEIYEYDRRTSLEISGKLYKLSPDNGYIQTDSGDQVQPPLHHCADGKPGSMSVAGRELLNIYSGKDPNEGLAFDKFMDSSAVPYVVGGAVILIVGIIVVVHIRSKAKLESYIHKARDYSPSDWSDTTTGSANSDDTWYDGKPWTADHSNARDV